MDPVAAAGFGRAAREYQRARPDYPADAIAWLGDALGLRPGRTVVDVGAGTGKFTTMLLPTGAEVIAVEPLDEMRAELHLALPGVSALAGFAEDLPLPDGSADAIVAAQAFHWFKRPEALIEFRRVLRPAGRLGLIWNERDTSVDWVAQLDHIVERHRTSPRHHSSHGDVNLGGYFTPTSERAFRHGQWLDRAGLRDRVLSMSWIAVLDDAGRAEVLAEVDELATHHPELAGRETFELPYVTATYWAERA